MTRALIVSRYPRVDTVWWKRAVAEELAAQGIEVGVVYSRSSLLDQLLAGVREFGPALLTRYLSLRPRAAAAPADDEAVSLADWVAERGGPVIRARRLGDAGCLRAVEAARPDLLILAGADIAPASLLALPRLGTINAHYGLLPRYRGMNVAEWSVYQGDPVGVTVHMVDPGIDTGAILLREVIELEPGDTLEKIRRKQQAGAARLLVRSAIGLRDGTVAEEPQRPEDGLQYFRMHPELRAVAERRLAETVGPG